MTDEQIEREIREKGLTAPRVTLESINAKVKSEHYFTANDGAFGAACFAADSETVVSEVVWPTVPESLERLTICILVLENGFTILGKSAPASAANFDAELGKKIARTDAINQIWPLEGYLLRERLHQAGRELLGGSFESDAVYKFAGWLTSREETIVASSHDDAAPMAEAVKQYLEKGPH